MVKYCSNYKEHHLKTFTGTITKKIKIFDLFFISMHCFNGVYFYLFFIKVELTNKNYIYGVQCGVSMYIYILKWLNLANLLIVVVVCSPSN